MTDEVINPHTEEAEAIKRIAASSDGALLHRYLRRVLETVIDMDSDSALRQHNGRRSLARDLMRLMAEGIDDRRAHTSDDSIISRSGVGGTAVARRRGAGRRITADTAVPAYSSRDE